MKFLLLSILTLSTGSWAQDYLQGEEMIYEDPSYIEENSSFAQERDPAGYEDYNLQEEIYERQEEEYYGDEPLVEDSEESYYFEEELSP